MNTQVRKMTFGKYKGQPILLIIAEHIGYIMWCFENISWFRLNENEQKFYDWQAIAIKKYHKRMIFPVETMYKHVKDKTALERLETPYKFIGDQPYISPETDIFPLLREAGAVRKASAEPIPDYDNVGRPWWYGLQHCVIKDIDSMSDEELSDMENYGVTPPIHPYY